MAQPNIDTDRDRFRDIDQIYRVNPIVPQPNIDRDRDRYRDIDKMHIYTNSVLGKFSRGRVFGETTPANDDHVVIETLSLCLAHLYLYLYLSTSG